MKIHYIVPDFHPNETGFAIAFKNLCLAIIERDEIEEIIVYTSTVFKKDLVLHPKIKLEYYPTPKKSLFFILKFPNFFGYFLSKIYLTPFVNMLKAKINKGDMIFLESIFIGHLSLILENKFKEINVITRIHGSFPEVAKIHNVKGRLYSMKLVSKLKNIAVTTYHYIDYLNMNFIQNTTNDRKYFIIPNTLPKDNIFGLNRNFNSKLKILQLGRMDEFGYYQKGFNDVLQSLFYLEETQEGQTLNGIEYTCIGSGTMDVHFQNQLKKIKNISVRYFQKLKNDDVQKEILQADIILLPSRYEGMSMFGTEALKMGKAFIFTSDGGLRDMIFDGYNGISVRPFDYLQISEAILKFKNNPKLIDDYSNNSIELFNEKFTHEKVNELFGILLKTLA